MKICDLIEWKMCKQWLPSRWWTQRQRWVIMNDMGYGTDYGQWHWLWYDSWYWTDDQWSWHMTLILELKMALSNYVDDTGKRRETWPWPWFWSEWHGSWYWKVHDLIMILKCSMSMTLILIRPWHWNSACVWTWHRFWVEINIRLRHWTNPSVTHSRHILQFWQNDQLTIFNKIYVDQCIKSKTCEVFWKYWIVSIAINDYFRNTKKNTTVGIFIRNTYHIISKGGKSKTYLLPRNQNLQVKTILGHPLHRRAERKLVNINNSAN